MQWRRLIVWSAIYCIVIYCRSKLYFAYIAHVKTFKCYSKFHIESFQDNLGHLPFSLLQQNEQCKVQHLVGHLVYIFLNNRFATVILFQKSFISLLSLPPLKTFKTHAHFRRLASDTQLLSNFSHAKTIIGVLNLCSIKKKRKWKPRL